MKKTGISRIELAQEIRKLFAKNKNIQEYSKIDDNFLVDYYFNRYDEKNNKFGVKIDNTNYNLKAFEEEFIRHLSNEKRLLEENGVDTEKVTKVVSAYSHSYSEKSILEDLPFEKDLKIFLQYIYYILNKQKVNLLNIKKIVSIRTK